MWLIHSQPPAACRAHGHWAWTLLPARRGGRGRLCAAVCDGGRDLGFPTARFHRSADNPTCHSHPLSADAVPFLSATPAGGNGRRSVSPLVMAELK
jgi:hypothetical protein